MWIAPEGVGLWQSSKTFHTGAVGPATSGEHPATPEPAPPRMRARVLALGVALLVAGCSFAQMKGSGVNLAGIYEVAGAAITFTAGGSKLRFSWTEQDGVVRLGARAHGPCDANLPAPWYSTT